MKLTIDQAALADVLGWAATVLPRKPELPVLAGLRLTAGEDGLTIQAYDLETSHAATVDALVEEPGSLVVSGLVLPGLVRTLRPGEVTLTSSGSEVSIRQGRTQIRLGLMLLEDFPMLPVMPPTVGSIGIGPLTAMVSSAAHPIDEASPFSELVGLRIEAEDDHLAIVGANRQMIAVRDTAWPFSPIKALAPLGRLETALRGFTTDEAARVTIGLSEGLLGLYGPGLGGMRAMTTRLYAIEKPMLWQRLLRAREADRAEAVVPADELLRALRRAAFLAGEEASATLTYDPDGWIGIQVVGHANYGEGSDLLDAQTSGEEPLTLGINPGWLADAVAALVSEDSAVRLGFAGQRQPITIRPAAADADDRAVTVLMPRDLSRGVNA